MDKEIKDEMSNEEANDIVTIFNTIVDIMESKELGTTKDANKRISEIVESIIKEKGGLAYYKLDTQEDNMLVATYIAGYNTFGVDFVDKLFSEKPDTAKTIMHAMARMVAKEDLA